MIKYLTGCGEFCAHIHILPVYHLSVTQHNSHHGSFGRGIDEGAIDCRYGCLACMPTQQADHSGPSQQKTGKAPLRLERGLQSCCGCARASCCFGM